MYRYATNPQTNQPPHTLYLLVECVEDDENDKEQRDESVDEKKKSDCEKDEEKKKNHHDEVVFILLCGCVVEVSLYMILVVAVVFVQTQLRKFAVCGRVEWKKK